MMKQLKSGEKQTLFRLSFIITYMRNFIIKAKKNFSYLTLFSLISACNSPFVPVKEAAIEPKSTTSIHPILQSTQKKSYLNHQETKKNISTKVFTSIIPKQEIVTKPITDLWQRIREGYGIEHPILHNKTQKQLTWFINHPDYIARIVERARPYLHHIVDELEQRDMPM